eukprot:12038_1
MSLIKENKQETVTVACSPNDFESILSDVDGVFVACSTPYHYEYIHKSLSAQKPVFTEKPVCATLAEIDELYDHAADMNMNGIFVGLMRRFDPTIQHIYNEIHNNRYLVCPDQRIKQDCLSNIPDNGIEKIISTSRDATYPLEYLEAQAGSVFYDGVVHDVDIMCHLTKTYPTSVYCSASANYGPIKDLGDYDRLFVNLKFESGVLGMIDWCRHSGFGYDQQLQVLGYNGQLHMTNPADHNMVKYKQNNGITNANPMDDFVDRYQDAYVNELEEFVQTVKDPTKQVHSTHEQIRNVQIILDAASKSAQLGQVVDIDYKVNLR